MQKNISSLNVCKKWLLPVLLLFSSWQLQADQIIINFDSPNFRKLLVALPAFVISSETEDEELSKISVQGPSLLASYLKFSGYFNVISESAFADLQGSLSKIDISSADSFKNTFNAKQWKSLGIESVLIGHLKRLSSGPVLEVRLIDVNKEESLLGKRYVGTDISLLEVNMKTLANRIIEAYSGKKGIFQTKLVFTGKRSKKSQKQVFISDFDGSNIEQITEAEAPHLSPNWSPDGKNIVYTSYKDGNPDLYTYNLETKRHRKVAFDKGVNSGGSFTPSGNMLVYTGSIGGDTELFKIPFAGGKRTRIISGNGLDVAPTFSPDGKWLAYVSGRYGNPHIFRATVNWKGSDFSIAGDKRLTFVGWYNATPAWSPDSQLIAFAGYDKDIDRFDIFTMNWDGLNMARLTLKSGDNENPSFSPNGELIVFNSNRVGNRNVKGSHQIYVMNKDGSGQRLLDTGLYSSSAPEWSPYLD